MPRSCWPAGGWSARWATETPRSLPSRATSSAGPTGPSGSWRPRARSSCSADSTAFSPYFEGAALDDSVAVAGYRADLATIVTDSVLGEFDRQRGEDRATYLRRFWGERDRMELRGDGERLREHYRRLFYARKNFYLTSLNRHYDIVERYRSGSRDFDDRGVIYIRHGEPTSRATYAAPSLEPNESWRYARPEGDLIFHFMAREDVQDFKLVESLFDVLGFSNALALKGGLAGAEGDPMAAAASSFQGAARPDLRAAADGRPDRHGTLPGRGAPGRAGQHRARHQDRQL